MFIGLVVAGLAAISWGFVYASSQSLVSQEFTAFNLLILATFVGGVVFFPLYFFTHELSLPHNNEVYSLLGMNVFGVLFAEYLIFESVYILGGTEASLIQVSYPLWTALDRFLYAKEEPSLSTIIGGFFILLGVGIISSKWENSTLVSVNNKVEDTSHNPSTIYSTINV
jgi:drug/metabolite transporter (DMT)-like permease